jgi:hypothetical protein
LKRKYSQVEGQLYKLERSHTNLERLIHALQSRSEVEATAIFQRLRDGADIETIVRHITTGDLLLQLQVTPETRYRYDFPFQTAMPVFLQLPDNPYLRSMLYEATFTSTPDDQVIDSPAAHRHRPEYFKPYSSATIVDPRLELIKPSAWTQVSTDDDLMRSLLKLYFQHEYPFFICFQKDLFLADMLTGSTRYCSPLLVNVILAQACVSAPPISLKC